MKICVVEKDGKLTAHKTNARHTKGCISHLPANTPPTDWKFLVKNTDGSVSVCEKKKSQYLKDLISGNISE